jgi:hypothetical protein
MWGFPVFRVAYGSELACEYGEGEAVVKHQPPRASGCEDATSSRGRRLGVVEASLSKKQQASPSWRAKCQSGFMTLPLVLLQEQSAMVLLLERALISWSLAMDERGGHEDLRGLGRRSVIAYVNGRTELYCSSLPCLSLPICFPALIDLYEVVPAQTFYSSRLDSYIETQGPTGGPEVIEILYNI